MSSINSLSPRLISQEVLDWLEQAFPVPDIMAQTPVETIKWAAAQREVVTKLKEYVGVKQSVGTINQEPGRPMPTGAVVRVGQ